MAVESEADRATLLSADDFGVVATYTPAGGSPSAVTGILDRNPMVAFEGQFGAVRTRDSVFLCATATLPAGAADGDALSADGEDFTVRDLAPDGVGMTRITLEKA